MEEFQNSVIINNRKFPVKSYSRSVTDDLVARFGDGSQGQTNLDLTKALTQQSFRGGMFQRVMDDPERVSTITGLYFNDYDQKLYLADNFNEIATYGSITGENISAWCSHGNAIYFAVNLTDWGGGTGTSNKIFKFIPSSNTMSTIAIDATVGASSIPINSMVSHGQNIYYTGGILTGGHKIIRYSPSANTSTPLAPGNTMNMLCSYRGRLYCLDQMTLYIVENEASGTASYTLIKTIGNYNPDYINMFNMLEFNGALWIVRSDGLFRYDGVDVFPVINDVSSQSPLNYNKSAVFNGALYFTRSNTLWRFDGINLEELQDFSMQGSVLQLVARDDRLWVVLRNSATSVSSDKFGEITVGTFSIFAYNGAGFYEYKIFSNDNSQYNYPAIMTGLGYSMFVLPQTYLNSSLEPRHNAFYYFVFNHSKEFTDKTNAQTSGTIIGSEIDCDFPSIPKTLNGVAIETDDFETNIDGIKIYVKVNNGIGYSDWELIYDKGGFRNGASDTSLFVDDYYLHDQTGLLQTTPLVFKRMQYKVVISNAVNTVVPRIRSITFRYTLQPRTRFKWQLTLGIFGKDADSVDPISELSATKLRQVIFDAHRNKLPILFYDIDWSTLKSRTNVNLTDFTDSNAVEAYTAEVVVSGQPFVADGEAIAVGFEDTYPWFNSYVKDVEYNSGTDEATYDLYPVINGHFGRRESIGGSDALTIPSDTTQVLRRSHAVYVTSIPTERFTLDNDTENVTNGHSDYKSEITIILTEV